MLWYARKDFVSLFWIQIMQLLPVIECLETELLITNGTSVINCMSAPQVPPFPPGPSHPSAAVLYGECMLYKTSFCCLPALLQPN
jgi:hypothetical protein